MIVKEELSFERHQDPRDALGVGNKKVREIRRDYEYLEPLVKSLKPNSDEFTFQTIRYKIDGLKRVIELIIIEYLRKEYGISFQEDSEDSMSKAAILFASAKVGDYKYELRRNGVGSTYWTVVRSLKGETLSYAKTNKFTHPITKTTTFSKQGVPQDFIETSQSTSLRIFDEKFQKLIKKYH